MNNYDLIFLNDKQVLAIQENLLPGAPCRDPGILSGALNRIYHAFLYESMTDVFDIASLYLIAIAKAHAFPDANKRTAFVATAVFLDLNFWELEITDELKDLTVRAAMNGITHKELSLRLKELSTPIPMPEAKNILPIANTRNDK